MACLEFSPKRCEAIRFLKIIHSVGDQQLGRHKVPFLTGVQRHLEKDGSPTFLGLWFIAAASALATRQLYKSQRKKCVPADSASIAHGWLVLLQGWELIGAGIDETVSGARLSPNSCLANLTPGRTAVCFPTDPTR